MVNAARQTGWGSISAVVGLEAPSWERAQGWVQC